MNFCVFPWQVPFLIWGLKSHNPIPGMSQGDIYVYSNHLLSGPNVFFFNLWLGTHSLCLDIASLIPARGTDIEKRDHEMGCQTKNGRPAETLESDVTQRSLPIGAGAPSAASLWGRQTQLTSWCFKEHVCIWEILCISRLINKVFWFYLTFFPSHTGRGVSAKQSVGLIVLELLMYVTAVEKVHSDIPPSHLPCLTDVSDDEAGIPAFCSFKEETRRRSEGDFGESDRWEKVALKRLGVCKVGKIDHRVEKKTKIL